LLTDADGQLLLLKFFEGGFDDLLRRNLLNACRAAALALAGFYLMSPPVTERPMLVINTNLPMSDWDNHGTFNSKEQCEKGKADLIAQNPTPSGRWNPSDALRNFQNEAIHQAQCIATDDPRLKGN
jgi:hypothetical protein